MASLVEVRAGGLVLAAVDAEATVFKFLVFFVDGAVGGAAQVGGLRPLLLRIDQGLLVILQQLYFLRIIQNGDGRLLDIERAMGIFLQG